MTSPRLQKAERDRMWLRLTLRVLRGRLAGDWDRPSLKRFITEALEKTK